MIEISEKNRTAARRFFVAESGLGYCWGTGESAITLDNTDHIGDFVAAQLSELNVPDEPPQPAEPPASDIPISQIVLNDVISGLRPEDLADVFAKSLASLFEIGDTRLTVDLPLLAMVAKATKKKPVRIHDPDKPLETIMWRPGPLTREEAKEILEALIGWLQDVESALDNAWAMSNVHHDRELFQKPLKLLRDILTDLRAGNRTIWNDLNPRKRGSPGDDDITRELKDRAAAVAVFLGGQGWDLEDACNQVSNYVTAIAAEYGLAGSPLRVGKQLLDRVPTVISPHLIEKSLAILSAPVTGGPKLKGGQHDNALRQERQPRVFELLLRETAVRYFAHRHF